ncbi:hypothetical protein [Halobaculum marinum]|uniref:Uncharacterized protein n=1 Tax=Halobaculum marinum TaxID=3031996 RepID=A0ABD5WRP3_9EURY|nr:hypothetical protein [Halobaculum sp. DT55]
MSLQTTIDSYSGAMASGAVDGWAPDERTALTASPSDPRRNAAPFVEAAESGAEAEQFTTFGFVEYRPHE